MALDQSALLELLEVMCSTDVVGIFANPDARLRLPACVLIEAHDEWQDNDRRYLLEESMAMLNPPAPSPLTPTPAASTKELAATAWSPPPQSSTR